MPIRGLLVVLALALAAAAGWYLYSHSGVLKLNGTVVSRDIMPESGADQSPPGHPLLAPSFDRVEVMPSGRATLAGRATPGAQIKIRSGKVALAEAKADAKGAWVADDVTLGGGTKEIKLFAASKAGSVVESAQVVIVDVPKSTDQRPLVVMQMPGEPSQVLQRPDEFSSGAPAVETADLADSGNVSLAGRAQRSAALRLYLDNEILGDAYTDTRGSWQLRAGAVERGAHTLRIDQIDEKGAAVARIEVSLDVGGLDAKISAGETVSVIPEGATWRIVRRVGEGVIITQVYRASASKAGDPAAIYPGQSFDPPAPAGSP